MAYYAALTSLLQTLEQIPQSIVHEQITSLQKKVSHLLVIFADFSQKSSFAMEDLGGRIRDASCEAKNIIQSQISRQVLSKSIISCGVSSCFWEVISALQNMVPAIHLRRQRLVDIEFHGLEQIIHEFGSILDDLCNKINDGEVEDLQPRNSPCDDDSSIFPAGNESLPVGLRDDLLRIIGWLINSTSELDIIAIVGMGGIGKTSLARNLYNNLYVKEHFDIHAWIVVSLKYHVRDMLTRLLDSLAFEGDELHQMSIAELKERAFRSLKGWRYLIVMDDVWSASVLYDVQSIFRDQSNGSRIIFSTCLESMAYNTYGGYIHHMSLLSPEASWDMLRVRVFGNECCPPALEDIGKRLQGIVKGFRLQFS